MEFKNTYCSKKRTQIGAFVVEFYATNQYGWQLDELNQDTRQEISKKIMLGSELDSKGGSFVEKVNTRPCSDNEDYHGEWRLVEVKVTQRKFKKQDVSIKRTIISGFTVEWYAKNEKGWDLQELDKEAMKLIADYLTNYEDYYTTHGNDLHTFSDYEIPDCQFMYSGEWRVL